jgi:DNA helicase II / ATP-dependent DNA helicase PcrA
MEYEITPERSIYLQTEGKIVLNACPGSGKTSSIVKKIEALKATWGTHNGNYSGLACLSFTNAAKEEIQNKYHEVNGDFLKYPHIISTIDSFINKYITLPFFNVILPKYPRPKIVDGDNIISNSVKVKYVKNGKVHVGVEYPLGTFKDNANRSLFRTYEIHDIWIEKGGRFSYKGKNPSSSIVQDSVFQEYGKAIFQKKINKGLITSLDSSYIAFQILTKHTRVGEYLIKRFPYVIIDEAQDNSEIQHAIFDKLIEIGLANIELIGDPYQSLYEWRHARPHLFTQKYLSSKWIGLPLSENRRSNQRIIDCFSLLRLRTDPQIKSKDVEDLNIPIVIYKYNESNKEQIIIDFDKKCKEYNLKKSQIVVRGNTLKDTMLGNIVPIEPWHSDVPYILIKSINSLNTQDIKHPINELRKLSVRFMFPTLNYKEKKELEDRISLDNNHNAMLYDLLRSIPPMSLSFDNWTLKCQTLLKQYFKLNEEPNFDFKKKINGYKMRELRAESIEKHFNKNYTSLCKIPITTIHQVKGKTLDALLYFFNENSIGQNVSFNDFVPAVSFPNEKQRMIYVACSRPRQFLGLAFPMNVSNKLIFSRFGSNVEIAHI